MVRIEALSKRFGHTVALRDVNLEIPKGIVVGLLGPNGSGKSTLLKIIAGLYHADTGRVLINQKPPSVTTREDTAYVPEMSHLYGWMTVGGTLEFAARFYADWQRAKAAELLLSMKLEPGQRVGSLSKGMNARLRLVLALARQAQLVLLDEPLAGIDPPSRTRILNAIIREYRSGGQTVILSTHEVSESEAVFDRVLFLKEGNIVLDEDTEELRETRGVSVEDLMREAFE